LQSLTLSERPPAPLLDWAHEAGMPAPRREAGAALPLGLRLGTASLVMAGMDCLGHGVAVFDAEGRLHYANSAARALLQQLRWSSGEPGSPSQLPPRWTEALGKVCSKGRRELAPLPSGEPRGYAALVPIECEGQHLAFVIFGREELCGAVELELFAMRHGMTAAEGEVLRQLCQGMPAAAIARSRHVSVATVLSQIGAIRQKTACRTVRQLLHGLSRMPQLRAAA
jgi:DNA-binding CsgD family transcriptional regulator